MAKKPKDEMKIDTTEDLIIDNGDTEINNEDFSNDDEVQFPEENTTEDQFFKNKSMGVMTQEEIEQEGAVNAPSDISDSELPKKNEESPIKKSKDIEINFECTFAPGGDSSVAFNHIYNGVEYNYELELKNRIYTLPSNVNDEDALRIRKALRANGFIDVTVSKAGAVFNKKKNKIIYHVVHSEHTERNRINGTISLALLDDMDKPMFYTEGPEKGKQIVKQLNIIDGKVETDDPKAYEALLRYGFYSAGKEEIQEKETD